MDTKQDKNSQPFKITGDWSAQSQQLKEKYPTLTDSDLKLEAGKENEMLKRVESRLNKGRQEVQNIIRKVQPAAL